MGMLAEVQKLLGGQIFGSIPVPSTDFSGKTVVITGANTGLGLEAAKHFARLNASTIVLGCRSLSKGAAAVSAISSSPHTNILVWEVDLCSSASVLAFSQRVSNELPRVDALVENAGVEMTRFELAEGLETSLTVNVVSTMLMAQSILPKLKESASRFGVKTNLTFVGSCMHAFADTSQFDVPDTQDLLAVLSDKEHANMGDRYQLSKLMLHLCFNEFVKQVGDENVIVNVVNPGWCGTELTRYKQEPLVQKLVFQTIGWTAEMGSRTLVLAASGGKETNGQYVAEAIVKEQSGFVRSNQGAVVQKRVWRDVLGRINDTSS